MRTNYAIVDDWYIEGDIVDVANVLNDGPGYTKWWPSVYLDVSIVQPGDEDQIGRVFDIHAKGWLPYTIRFQARITDSNFPHGSHMEVWGDFNGEGIWSLEQQGRMVHVRFTWDVRVAKPLLHRLSFLLHPIFAANHRWAMRKGEVSLKLELARRRAGSAEGLKHIPPPPGPTWSWLLPDP